NDASERAEWQNVTRYNAQRWWHNYYIILQYAFMLNTFSNRMLNKLFCVGAVAVFVCLLPFAQACGKELESHPFVGVTLHQIVRDKPRAQIIHVAQIDLSAKGLSFLVTPSNGDPNGEKPGDPNLETTRQTALQFIKEQKAQLGI